MGLNIRGEDKGDYFSIVCEKCNQNTINEYLGWDPAFPHFRASCENCGESGTWKLTGGIWTGLPVLPDD